MQKQNEKNSTLIKNYVWERSKCILQVRKQLRKNKL